MYALVAGRRELFQWLLLACLLSDILDGLIARMFHLSSPLGAFLDSTADMLLSIIAVLGLFAFQKEFLAAHFAPLLDCVDLDGAALVSNDPYVGATIDGGVVRLPEGPGLGVTSR